MAMQTAQAGQVQAMQQQLVFFQQQQQLQQQHFQQHQEQLQQQSVPGQEVPQVANPPATPLAPEGGLASMEKND